MKGRARKGTKFSKLPPGPEMTKGMGMKHMMGGMGAKAGKRARAKRLAKVPL